MMDLFLRALGKRLMAPFLTKQTFLRLLSQQPFLPAEAFVPGRIVHCSPSLGAGGSERQTCNTLSGLVALGYDDCRLLCRSLQGRENSFYLKLLERNGIITFNLAEAVAAQTPPSLVGALRHWLQPLPWPYSEETLGFAAVFAAWRPAIIHIWQDMPLAALAARLVGIPLTVLSWRSLSPPHFGYNHAYFQPAYRLLADQPGLVMLNNSEAGRNDYAAWLGIDPGRIRVLRNGLDPTFLQCPEPEAVDALRTRLRIPAQAPVVGSIFRLSREKDPWLWLETAKKLATTSPECHFVIFGEGPLLRQFRSVVREAGFASCFHLPGRTDKTAVALGLFDVFLLCSSTEGTPNVLIEAQGQGVPVVTLAAGGTPETVLHGESGFVVQERDANHCAAAVQRVLSDGVWRKRASEVAPAFVARRFGLARMLSETLDVYGLDNPLPIGC
ncbi:hypothetical protein C3Y92_19955 (plasmid) [Solidesulfovibrio carbinolicus]|uniref:Glycosyltransferase n=2 Tax=Solidesulfovibrio carbinolicus TaxID=296842 RepID=A0A4P6HTP5_9BACT|nr:hypothetical protein C3Y92_19955 [Solidesulfovibrio carbinolicus]